MLTITTGEATPINFELTLSGDATGDIKVVVTIDCGDVAYRFPAQSSSAGWCAIIPETVTISPGEYPLCIDVYMGNHLYPALEGKVVVTAPFKPTATLATTAAPAAPTAALKVTSVATSATLTSPPARVSEGATPNPAPIRARSITRITRE